MAENYVPSLDELIILDDFETDNFEELATTSPETTEDPADTEQEGIEGVDTEEEVTDDTELDTELETGKDEPSDDIVEPEEEVETEEDNSETNQIGTFYNFMKKSGALNVQEDFEFDGTLDGLLNAIEESTNNTKKSLVQEIWKSLPEDYQIVLEHGLNGGNDIKKVYDALSANSLGISDYDIENVNHQEEIMRKYLKRTTKYTDSKIESRIKMFRDSDILEQESESAWKELKEFEKADKAKLIEDQKKQERLERENIEKSYKVFQNVTNDMNVTDARKKQILDAVYGKGTYNGKKQSYFDYVDDLVFNNPEHYAQLVNLYLDYDPKKGFNLNKNKSRKAKTEAARNLRNELNDILNSAGIPTPSKKSGKEALDKSFDLEKFIKYSH